MDFSNRNVQSHQGQAAVPGGHPATGAPGGRGGRTDKGKWARIGAVVAVVAVAVLLVGLILFISSSDKTESTYVDSGKLQAVFLNTGQVYFGNIKSLNDKYFVLTNIYYLQTSNSNSGSSSSSNANVTLVKLGCELHRPYDQMVINRPSVTFWENLESSGQVAQAVNKFQQQNPHGQQCSDQSSSSGSTTNTAQPASSNNSTPATTNNSTTTKP